MLHFSISQGFVLVDDSIDPENNAYLEIMKEARQQQVPILTISDLKASNYISFYLLPGFLVERCSHNTASCHLCLSQLSTA